MNESEQVVHQTVLTSYDGDFIPSLKAMSANDTSRIFTAEKLEQALALARGQNSTTSSVVDPWPGLQKHVWV